MFASYKRVTLRAVCLMIFATFVISCVVNKPQHIVPLSDVKAREGSLKGIDGTLTYTMNYTHKEQDSGKGLGTLTVAGVVQPNLPLNSINIEVFFIDADNTITGKESLFTTMAGWGSYKTQYRSKESTFNKEIIIPEGTDALGFSVYTHDRPQRPGRGGK